MKPMRLPIVCLVCVTLVPAAGATRVEMDAQSSHVLRGAIRTQGLDWQLSATRLRVAQGSTGGTLGKADQSLSGDQPQAASPTVPKQKNTTAEPARASVLGRWQWTATCPISGTWTGTMELRGSAQRLVGTMKQDQPGDAGSITGGNVSGQTVVVVRQIGAEVQTVTGTLSGSGRSARIVGQTSGFGGTCNIVVTRP